MTIDELMRRTDPPLGEIECCIATAVDNGYPRERAQEALNELEQLRLDSMGSR